jgi:hypothetical protein
VPIPTLVAPAVYIERESVEDVAHLEAAVVESVPQITFPEASVSKSPVQEIIV